MELDERSKYLRRLAVRCMRGGQRGHIGSTMSLIEIMRVLYDDIKQPDDKIILSKGHGGIAQYIMLADKGIIPMDELDRFCQKDGMLGGHPSHKILGIECDTGALGHGLSIGVGMALADKILDQMDKRDIYVVLGDGEINEGSIWEAAMSASKHGLFNLKVVIDYNKIQSSGFVKDVQPLEPLKKKWQAFGFQTDECDGHYLGDDIPLLPFTENLKNIGGRYAKPRCLIAHTIKGKGILFAENDPNWHYKSKIDEETFLKMEAALI